MALLWRLEFPLEAAEGARHPVKDSLLEGCLRRLFLLLMRGLSRSSCCMRCSCVRV